MDSALLKKFIRQGLLAVGGGLVANGSISDGQVDAVAGALAILVSVGWMVWTHRKENEELRMKK